MDKRQDSHQIQAHLSGMVLKTQPSNPFTSELKLSNSSFAAGTILQILTDYFSFSVI